MILTAGSDSNGGEQVGTVPHGHGHTPAGGGRCRTSRHRFGSEGSRTAATEDPQLPNDRTTSLTVLVTQRHTTVTACVAELASNGSSQPHQLACLFGPIPLAARGLPAVLARAGPWRFSVVADDREHHRLRRIGPGAPSATTCRARHISLLFELPTDVIVW